MAIEFGQILCDMPLDVPQPPAIYHHYEGAGGLSAALVDSECKWGDPGLYPG